MKLSDFEALSIDELWAYREKIEAVLVAKLVAEHSKLKARLTQLARRSLVDQTSAKAKRRSYPTVFPKYRNPNQPSETWAGRGKLPRWLAAELKSGKRLDEFRIESVAA